MIASPTGAANHHIEVLAELSTKLLEPDFISQMLATTSKAEVLTLLSTTGGAKVAPAQTRRAPQASTPEPQDRSIKAQLNTLKQHLLFGTSHMIPFIVAGAYCYRCR